MWSCFARLIARLGHARARHLLIACGIFVGLAAACGSALVVMELRRHAIAESERDLKNLSLVLAEEAARSFEAVQLVQLGLIEHMRELGVDSVERLQDVMTTEQVHQNLADRIAGLRDVNALAIIDRNGRMLNNSRLWPFPDIDLSDRDFFRVLTRDPSRDFVIDGPLQNRIDHQWSIALAQRYTAPDGTTLGYLSTAITIGHFERLFSHLSVIGDPSFNLFTTDGVLLARYPNANPGTPSTLTPTGLLQNSMAALNDDRIIRVRSLFDGRDRVVAPHRVAGFPLFITASNTTAAVLATWRAEGRTLIIATILMELVLAAIVFVGVRHLRYSERLEAANAATAKAELALLLAEERERGARALQIQAERFDSALSNMQQGLVMVGEQGQLLVVNRRFQQLFGIPDSAVSPGMSYDEFTNVVVTTGNVGSVDMRGVRDFRNELIARNRPTVATWELSDGRSFNVTHQPMEDGWVSTYEDITEQRRVDATIKHMAHHDALTNLPNRVLFRTRLDQSVSRAQQGDALALLYLDLDQFKAVNDTLGHPVGDALLQAVAKRLTQRTRETDLVARLGGDEFAIIQAHLNAPTDAVAFAERLIDLMNQPFEINGHHIIISTSVGIAFAPDDTRDADQLLKCADLALYRAKIDGRGTFRSFHPDMDRAMQARRRLELDLRHALEDNQLKIYYQPVVDVRARTVTGMEALLRWRHPERGIVGPINFIPLAEEIGLIIPIGEFVLRKACATAASWPGNLRLAVNLSPAQFKSRDLVAAVAAALQASALDPSRLELEITETVMLQDIDAALSILHQLHGLGVRIAMDDFGTGYSSLSFLRQFSFDRIKIDQSFVRELGNSTDSSAIIRAVTMLGHELGMETTAEGVETQAQFDAIALAGCSEVQGYLFSKPVPELQIAELLRRIDSHAGAWTPRPAALPAVA